MLVSFEDKSKRKSQGRESQPAVAVPTASHLPLKDTAEQSPGAQKIQAPPEMISRGETPGKAIANIQALSARTQVQAKGNFVTRLKKIKNFEIYLAVGLIVIMIAIYMTTFSSPSSSAQKKTSEQDYALEIEKRLVETLSQIRGAGHIEAMVTVIGSATIEVAYNIDERTVTQSGGTGSSTTTTTVVKTPVIINGKDGPQPLILFEIKPKIKGVVIVSSGAYDVGVRLQLLRAVQAVIADDSVRIEIFTGK